ncbi:hypothetical protein [Spiroplasma endosymbiont of Nebria brevicollis]|uniref:hypothetical protein n=1 Tax=Spiroplasma endosymbiont of Nebria brevicollis TaxID=3066284 RepID=UPI00313B4C90
MGMFKRIINSTIKNSIKNTMNNSTKNNNLKLLDECITKEISRFLILNDDKNYKFKDNELKNELENSLKAVIVDLRGGLFNLKSTYINKSPNKIKEINNIISYYYKLDKKIL